jgi:phosphatidate cytidylyltransferase
MSNLRRRVAFAAPGAVFFVAVTWFGQWPFRWMMGAIALFIVYEMLQGSTIQPSRKALARWIAFSVATLVLLTLLFPTNWTLLLGITLFFASMVLSPWPREGTPWWSDWIQMVFIGIYAPVSFRLLMELRVTDVLGTASSTEGFYFLLMTYLMVWGNDIFAYFGGGRFGSTLLAPSISPSKTWEGVAFGVIGTTVGFGLGLLLMTTHPSMREALTLGIVGWFSPLIAIVSIFGPLGDLMASRLKRFAGVKDSSQLLPGHGGFLDRFDSLTLSIPFVWLYVSLIMNFMAV